MSQKHQKVEGNGEPALSGIDHVSNAGGVQDIQSTDLNPGTTPKLQASRDVMEGTEAVSAAEDSGHGTKDEDTLNCRPLVPFTPQSAHPNMPVLAFTIPATKPSQQANGESNADHQTGHNYGYQQYNVPPTQAVNDAYGVPVTYARVSEDDFKALNYEIFNHEAPRGQIMDGSRIVVAIVEGNAVLIHARVLVHSHVLCEIYNNGSEVAVTDRAVFPDIGLPEFKILMLAIYGIKCPILGQQTYAGVDYIKALSLSNIFRCEARVYDSIAKCTRGYFSGFKNWAAIPSNGLTQDLHRKHMMDINEAFKEYKMHVRGSGSPAFADNAFAILLWEFCPARVFCLYSDILDHELVRQVSNAALRQRENISPFSAQETKLFTRPAL
ncbi:hypothetical protein F4859DRAFT_513850 [Xylaria cf. heliscus]|nr:hypothetical protein F4859DRAFT_513850 [Xylaria cf. heliscus]